MKLSRAAGCFSGLAALLLPGQNSGTSHSRVGPDGAAFLPYHHISARVAAFLPVDSNCPPIVMKSA